MNDAKQVTPEIIPWNLELDEAAMLIELYTKQIEDLETQISFFQTKKNAIKVKVETLKGRLTGKPVTLPDSTVLNPAYEKTATRFRRTTTALLALNKLATIRQIIEYWETQHPTLFADEKLDFGGLQNALSATLKAKVDNGDLGRVKAKTGDFYYGMSYWFDKNKPRENYIPESVEF